MSLYHIDCLYNDLLLDYNSPGSPTQPLLLWFAVYFLNEVEKTDPATNPTISQSNRAQTRLYWDKLQRCHIHFPFGLTQQLSS